MPLNPLAPFVDSELVALRAEQRRLLADIPDRVVDGLLHGMPTTELPLSTAGGRAEARCASWAATRWSAPTTSSSGRAGRWRPARSSTSSTSGCSRRAATAAVLLDEIVGTMRAELADMPGPDDDLRSMHKMVVLLDLADRAGTDGYRDPRLDAGTTPGTVAG